MAWIATDGDGEIYLYERMPIRSGSLFVGSHTAKCAAISEDVCKILVGRVITNLDEPAELAERPQAG